MEANKWKEGEEEGPARWVRALLNATALKADACGTWRRAGVRHWKPPRAGRGGGQQAAGGPVAACLAASAQFARAGEGAEESHERERRQTRDDRERQTRESVAAGGSGGRGK